MVSEICAKVEICADGLARRGSFMDVSQVNGTVYPIISNIFGKINTLYIDLYKITLTDLSHRM